MLSFPDLELSRLATYSNTHREPVLTSALWTNSKKDIVTLNIMLIITVLGHYLCIHSHPFSSQMLNRVGCGWGLSHFYPGRSQDCFQTCFSYFKTSWAAKIFNWLGKCGVHQPLLTFKYVFVNNEFNTWLDIELCAPGIITYYILFSWHWLLVFLLLKVEKTLYCICNILSQNRCELEK